MDIYRFRSRARMVAIVDLILSSMSLCICLILLLGAVMISTAQVNVNMESEDDQLSSMVERHKEESKKMLVTFMWMLAVITSIATIIQIVAAIKLLNATQLGKEPVGALKLCVFWRHVCVVFTLLLMISIVFIRVDNNSSIFTLIQVLLRAWAIYIVTQFMKELDAAIATGVLPMHCQPGSAPIIAGVAYAYIPPNQSQQQPPQFNPDMNVPPPSYQEVMKDPPLTKE